MQGVVAADQVRGAGTGAFARRCILQRIDHAELLGQAQVIIAAEASQPLAVHLQADAITTLTVRRVRRRLGIAQGALGVEAGGQVGAGHGG